MALPLSGQIAISDLATEFGGEPPNSLAQYYRGGALVPDVVLNNDISTEGAISLEMFYGAAAATIEWVTPAGTIGNVYALSFDITTLSVEATFVGGVTYSVVLGELPLNSTLDSATGQITSFTGVAADTTSVFTIRATSITSPNLFDDREFSIQELTERVQTYRYNGGNQTFNVPISARRLLFKCWGDGGTAGHGLGGGGGFAGGRKLVQGGEALTVRIGFGGGSGSEGYRGGGYSGVFAGSITQGNAILIAGGGGGQGCDYACGGSGNYRGGAGGGASGSAGVGAGCASGGGGTQTAGGSLCACNTQGTNQRGSALQGGSSGFGGGGGGGYFGGGSGCRQGYWQHTAGGGGSGFTGRLDSDQVNTSGGATTAANAGDPDRAANVGNSNNRGQITVRF